MARPSPLKNSISSTTASARRCASKTKKQALEIMKRLAAQLHDVNVGTLKLGDKKAAAQLRISQFAQMARQYSEDASAQSGGDLGWLTKGQLDPDFETAAWNLPIGMPSGIVETKFGYHLILVEEKEPAGTEPFEHAKASIREFLMTQRASDVMQTVSRL